MNPRKHKILLLYQLFIALIALVSILLLLFDCAHAINLSQSPYVWIDRGIWAILVVDYFARLAIAKDKIQFFNFSMKISGICSQSSRPTQSSRYSVLSVSPASFTCCVSCGFYAWLV